MDWDWSATCLPPRGFRASGIRAGIKTEGPDLALIACEDACGAATFTTNQFCAAPVLISRRHAADGRLRAIVANSGCANACTGDAGLADAREMAALTARELGILPEEVLVASTGIIGHPLPMPLLRQAIPRAVQELSPEGLPHAARAILTTDTETKEASLTVEIGGSPVILTGMAKGAGMVAPRMAGPQETGPTHATVFGFFATDANIDAAHLQPLFQRAMDRSFNRTTVDGDTSTNDTACILASSGSGSRITPDSPAAELFEQALTAVAQDLARKLARGGEGATRLITVRVEGARTEDDAERIALTIANSPLVKTAVFGRDANWGRIAMAAGRAGVPFDQTRVDILLNGMVVARGGMQVPFDPSAMRESFEQDEIILEVRLNEGAACACAWTCDFSYKYVEINAEYHT